MTSHDILHQTSCAYILQQNRVVEHKNKHHIETIHTFLIYGRVPQYFWMMLFLLDVILLVACRFRF